MDSIEKSHDSRDTYDWNMFIEKTQQCNTECYIVLQENLADIIRWDNHAVSSLHEVSQNQVVSHRDLDPIIPKTLSNNCVTAAFFLSWQLPAQSEL